LYLCFVHTEKQKRDSKKVNIMDTIRIKCNAAKLLVTETVEATKVTLMPVTGNSEETNSLNNVPTGKIVPHVDAEP
jgi:hypothetical protein